MTRNELTKLWAKITSLFARKTDLNSKQDIISDLDSIRSGAELGSTALQSYTETDPTVPSWAKLSTKPSYSYSEILNTPTLATVATSGSYNDLSNKPTIPSAPGTLVTNKTTAQTASAGEAMSGTINLHKVAKTGTYSDLIGTPTIPAAPGTLNTDNTTAQTVSSSEALSGTIKLHKVSKTGSYNDLTNKPTIPTVNNATLTIQKNGTNVATFTANASTGATANITVPVATSDLTNDSGFLGDTDISYDANTKTLIIGSGSVNTYTITFNIEYGFSVRINGGEPIINQSPISVNEGDSISGALMVEDRPTVTMGGESIVVYSEGPDTFYFTIESVTGDIVVSV